MLRNLGAHYTSEKNILKVIQPLFLDQLREDFNKAKRNRRTLQEFHKSLSQLRFMDPACGCGNFLVITYRELRLLELEILKILYKDASQFIDINQIIWVTTEQFYGIEYQEFPAKIAEVAMWLIEHQMNMLVSEQFGKYVQLLPLRRSAHIHLGNALKTDWSHLLDKDYREIEAQHTKVIVEEPSEEYQTLKIRTKNLTIIDQREAYTKQKNTSNPEIQYDYIIGNPPFIGKHLQSEEQKAEMANLFSEVRGAGVLDYVSAWYLKAAQLIMNTRTKVGFVSTNSIVQGEQVGVLWNFLFKHYNIKIHFAHRTFSWHNEARGNAAVHVVIIGFAAFDTKEKPIFVYDDTKGDPHETPAQNINPYLVDAVDVFIEKRRNPICKVPQIVFGNMPNDGGFLLMTDEEKEELCAEDKILEKYTRPLLSAKEFLNNGKRWCVWLKDYNPSEIKNSQEILRRIQAVRNYRLASTRSATQRLAATPYLFGEIRQPDSDFVLIPRVSSERRRYIPMGFFDKETIVSDTCLCVPDATLYHFGILTSQMHMTWVNNVCGRLKTDYRYSNEIVYNNFPWPENPSASMVADIETKAQKVLNIRQKYPKSSLADLYDPLLMPADLVKAHQALDHAVDKAYRSTKFNNDAERMEFLFEEWRRKV